MKIKEIHADISAVIPTGDYSNYKPMYGLKAELEEGENVKECFESLRDHARAMLKLDWTQLREKDKLKFFEQARFYEKNKVKLPSVTTVLSWSEYLYRLRNPEKFAFQSVSEAELDEYAARGTIVHKAVENWFKTKEWTLDLPGLQIEQTLVKESKLEATDCNWLGFWEKFGKDIEFRFMERTVYGRGYAGTLDGYGTFKGKPAVFDVKTTSNYTPRVELKFFKQMSAYAKALNGLKKPEVLVIIPLNPSNKCGFGAPKVTENSDGLYQSFLKDLGQFNSDFKSLV